MVHRPALRAPTAGPLGLIAARLGRPSRRGTAATAAATAAAEPATVAGRPIDQRRRTRATTDPAVATTALAVPRLPRIEVGRLVWKDIKARVEDQGVTPAAVIALSDAGIEVTDLKIDPEFSGPAQPGHFKAWLAAPGLAKKFELTGTVTPGRDRVEVDATVVGDGLTTAAVETYLKPLGIEPVLTDGSLRARATATLHQTADSVGGSLALATYATPTATRNWRRWTPCRVDTVEYRRTGLAVESIEVDRPRPPSGRRMGRFPSRACGCCMLAKPKTLPSGATSITRAHPLRGGRECVPRDRSCRSGPDPPARGNPADAGRGPPQAPRAGCRADLGGPCGAAGGRDQRDGRRRAGRPVGRHRGRGRDAPPHRECPGVARKALRERPGRGIAGRPRVPADGVGRRGPGRGAGGVPAGGGRILAKGRPFPGHD